MGWHKAGGLNLSLNPSFKIQSLGISLAVQWLKLHIPMQGVHVPWSGAKITHASRPKSQSIKKKHYCNKFSEDFKHSTSLKKSFK